MNVNERILVAIGDQGLVARDTDIFTSPIDLYDKTTNTVNIPEGRLAIWDPKTRKALDQTNIATVEDIVISTKVNGELRSISGDQIRGIGLQYTNVGASVDGAAAIKAFLFRCTSCNTSNSLTVEVEDNRSWNDYPWPKAQRYTFTVHTDCTGCDECSGPESNGDKIACKFRDYINGKPVRNATAVVNSGHKVDPKDIPVTAMVAYDKANSFKTYCWASAGACTGKVAGPKTVTFTHPDDGAVSLDLSAYLDGSGDITYTDFYTVAKLIDNALGGYGDVHITKGAGANSQVQLLVSTCIDDLVIDDFADSAVTPCSQLNPLTPISVTDYCPSCDGANTTETYDHGVILITDEVKLDCEDCPLPQEVISRLTRDVEIYPVGDAWVANSTHVLTIQEHVRPEGLGYYWRHREWAQDPGGINRGGITHDVIVGPYHQLTDDSRSRKMKTKCCQDYCVYSIGHSSPHTGGLPLTQNLFGPNDVSVVLIEEGASTTRTQFQTVYNAWSAARGKGIAAVDCASPNTLPNGQLY